MARLSRRPLAPSPKRALIWNQGPGSATVTNFSSSTTSVLGLGQTGFAATTLMRLRGYLAATLTTVGAITDGFHCAVGVGLVTADAFTVGGVTSLPNPFDDIDWKWIYHRIFDVHCVTATIGDGVNAGAVHLGFEVDTKAMRKMAPNETLFASMQVVEDGAATMDVFFDSRMLIKLR